jgi:hypothetical protein
MKNAAEKAADAIVGKARADAETSKGEAKRDVDALVRRREEIKAEMSRVQGVLDALAGPILKPAAAKAKPDAP